MSVTKWTRTHTNRLLFDAGFGVYDQEYQENYQPDVFAGAGAARARIIDSSTGKIANAWNNPADHFSKLFTEQFAASYVTGSHSLRFGATISQAQVAADAAVHARRRSRSPTTACCRTAT